MLTLESVVAVLEPIVRAHPSRKPRDPVERALLLQAGDPAVLREDPLLTRVAGERPTRANSTRRDP